MTRTGLTAALRMRIGLGRVQSEARVGLAVERV